LAIIDGKMVVTQTGEFLTPRMVVWELLQGVSTAE
jgi:hypothetical protein